MNVFQLRDQLVENYGDYIKGFIHIRDSRISRYVDEQLRGGLLWPDALVQLNPFYQSGGSVAELVKEGLLHDECRKIFRRKQNVADAGSDITLYHHQTEAIRKAKTVRNYVLSTGTASGKSLTYIVPIVDYVLRNPKPNSIKAIIVYPMNALANSQRGELEKYINFGYPDGKGKVTFDIYTGPTDDAKREAILNHPPDILITNYVMLEFLLTRPRDKKIVEAAKDLRFIVLDELHTYRGRQGADVALLIRRLREAVNGTHMQCIGTSATMSSTGTYDERREQVAGVASRLFGSDVTAGDVIGETLRRATEGGSIDRASLVKRLNTIKPPSSDSFDDFLKDPLTVWIESNMGVSEVAGRLERAKPMPVMGGLDGGAAKRLSDETGIDMATCGLAIQEHLLAAYKVVDGVGKRPFAFKLHQFISRGDTVYSTVEAEDVRQFVSRSQKFHPDSPEKILLPFVFCRECGQEYYAVSRVARDSKVEYEARDLGEMGKDDEEAGEAGFLYINQERSWPDKVDEVLANLPEEWKEEKNGVERIKSSQRENLPRNVIVDSKACESSHGVKAAFVPAPFRFCLYCGVAYKGRGSDFAKLASLATEGRSTATTILNFGVLTFLRDPKVGLKELSAQKVLSFTDNRQDAALQSGHFNDFIQIGLLRAALYRAVLSAGAKGLTNQDLVEKVVSSLDLDPKDYAVNPDNRFGARDEAIAALQQVLAYRLFRDLQRGWRITAPNLEQCDLLHIDYGRLNELAEADDVWKGTHSVLSTASAETRKKVCGVLLDLMRRELAIKVECLDPAYQERAKKASYQHLFGSWALDEDEKMQTAGLAIPRPRSGDDYQGNLFLSSRGGFGQYLRRGKTFPENTGQQLKTDEVEDVIKTLFEKLELAGIVEHVQGRRSGEDIEGYRVKADRVIWLAGPGKAPRYDPIRVPSPPELGGRVNPFFVDFYKNRAFEGKGLLAREHTAQVDAEDREERENQFRKGSLQALFCSPTMELGIDISELNVVNMRNVPPTPANYAQRSGRAGREGQPALAFTYCSSFSSHDQYYFRRPHDMVSGVVAAPRLDLSNEELIKAHVHSLFLSVSGLKLGESLTEVLALGQDIQKMCLKPEVGDCFDNPAYRDKTKVVAHHLLETISGELEKAAWYTPDWLDRVINNIKLDFLKASERWWNLYDTARKQLELQSRISTDLSKSQDEREKAMFRHKEAQSQFALLTDTRRLAEADFYSYRYFASEGFLPGFNFPRLPISAYMPASVGRKNKEGFLSRPRFLAVSEFGPRAIVYHEGNRYRIERAILPLRTGEEDLPTASAKRCEHCGYFHPIQGATLPDLCEHCGSAMNSSFNDLFRMQNVSTKRVQRINSDEEERQRLGYEIETGIRFNQLAGQPGYMSGQLVAGGVEFAKLTYAHTATITRINLGWRRRKDKDRHGFMMDLEWGRWERSQEEDESEGGMDPSQMRRSKRVIPFVEDRRNCLVIQPVGNLTASQMASLQSVLKVGIQREFQLEDMELAAEALPGKEDRKYILFYEASEGGAGVLKRMVEEQEAWNRVIRRALEICHFDPQTGADLGKAPHAHEKCVAACYDCLLSYYNQFDHDILDRRVIKDILLSLRDTKLEASPVGADRASHLDQLMRRSDSSLEKDWLKLINKHHLRLPDASQVLIERCQTRPDFLYRDHQTVVYVDGPHHKYPDRQNRDRQQHSHMEDAGYTVLRFDVEEDWMPILKKYPEIFGRLD